MHGYLSVVCLVHDIRDLCAESDRRQARGNQRALLGQRHPECSADVMISTGVMLSSRNAMHM